MKPVLLATALLLALTSPASAETVTCTGRVKIDAIKVSEGLYEKGEKIFSVGNCVFEGSARQKQVLRTCPMGSRCRVEGTEGGDATIETIISVTKIDPYREGVRDYREGLCYRARPYLDGSPEQKQWERGYKAHPTRKQTKRMDEICFPGRIH